MLILFCFVVKLESPTKIPAKEVAFYVYMLVRGVHVERGERAVLSMPCLLSPIVDGYVVPRLRCSLERCIS